MPLGRDPGSRGHRKFRAYVGGRGLWKTLEQYTGERPGEVKGPATEFRHILLVSLLLAAKVIPGRASLLGQLCSPLK